MHLLKAKLMSVVQAKLPISNINQTVPHAARSWQGTIPSGSAGEGCCSSGDLELIGYRRDHCQLEFWNLCQSMPGGDLPKLHRETRSTRWSTGQLELAGPQDFPLRSAIGMVFVMLESTILDFHEWCGHCTA